MRHDTLIEYILKLMTNFKNIRKYFLPTEYSRTLLKVAETNLSSPVTMYFTWYFKIPFWRLLNTSMFIIHILGFSNEFSNQILLLLWIITNRPEQEHSLRLFLKTRSPFIVQTGLELVAVFLWQPTKCWNYSCVPPYPERPLSEKLRILELASI